MLMNDKNTYRSTSIEQFLFVGREGRIMSANLQLISQLICLNK